MSLPASKVQRVKLRQALKDNQISEREFRFGLKDSNRASDIISKFKNNLNKN